MRINARLDDDAQQQIDYLTQATGQSVSHVVREAVARYYRDLRTDRVGLRHFAQAIGQGDSGGSGLASNVKQHYADALAAKYPQHLGKPSTK